MNRLNSLLSNKAMRDIEVLPYELYAMILDNIPTIDRLYLSPMRTISGGEGGELSVTQVLKQKYRGRLLHPAEM